MSVKLARIFGMLSLSLALLFAQWTGLMHRVEHMQRHWQDSPLAAAENTHPPHDGHSAQLASHDGEALSKTVDPSPADSASTDADLDLAPSSSMSTQHQASHHEKHQHSCVALDGACLADIVALQAMQFVLPSQQYSRDAGIRFLSIKSRLLLQFRSHAPPA